MYLKTGTRIKDELPAFTGNQKVNWGLKTRKPRKKYIIIMLLEYAPKTKTLNALLGSTSQTRKLSETVNKHSCHWIDGKE